MFRSAIRFALAVGLGGLSTSVAAGASNLTVVLTNSSDKASATYFFVPSDRVKNPQSIDASLVSQMIVVDFDKSPADHKTIAEHFASEPGGGDFHLALDLPNGIVAVDLHNPNRFTAEQLKSNGNHQNMELFAGSRFKERGKAVYARYYRELTALRASKTLDGKVVGQVDANGAFAAK